MIRTLFISLCWMGALSSFLTLNCHAVSTVTEESPSEGAANARNKDLEPILILPGLMGSMLISRTTKNIKTFPSICDGRIDEDWSRLWTQLGDVLNLRCFKTLMRLIIQSDGSSREEMYIETDVPDDGIYATSYTDPSNFISRHLTAYMANLFAYFKKKGYDFYNNFDVMPYDWRFSPYDFAASGAFFDRLQQRVERMVHDTGKKVTLVGHSMGGALSAFFLSTHVTAEWKEANIKQFISLAGAYGGSVKSLAVTLTGAGDYVSPWMVDACRYIPGMHSLVPAPSSITNAWKNVVIFETNERSYTSDDMKQLYRDVNFLDYAPLTEKLRTAGYTKAPGVRTHCLYTNTLSTLEKIWVRDITEYSLNHPKFTMGDGDGTVSAASLAICSSWATKQEQEVKTVITKSEHGAMVNNDQSVWDYIFAHANDMSSPHERFEAVGESSEATMGKVTSFSLPEVPSDLDPEDFFLTSGLFNEAGDSINDTRGSRVTIPDTQIKRAK